MICDALSPISSNRFRVFALLSARPFKEAAITGADACAEAGAVNRIDGLFPSKVLSGVS
jgi:hypothetical protein